MIYLVDLFTQFIICLPIMGLNVLREANIRLVSLYIAPQILRTHPIRKVLHTPLSELQSNQPEMRNMSRLAPSNELPALGRSVLTTLITTIQ